MTSAQSAAARLALDIGLQSSRSGHVLYAVAWCEPGRGPDQSDAAPALRVDVVHPEVSDWESLTRDHLAVLRALATSGGPPRTRGAYWLTLSFLLRVRLHLNMARIACERALRLFADLGDSPREVAACHLNLGVVHSEAARIRESAESFTKALDLLHEAGAPPEELAACELNLGAVQRVLGLLDESHGHLSAACSLAHESPHPGGILAGCLASLGTFYRTVGRLGDAGTSMEEALELFEAIPGSARQQAVCWLNLATIDRLSGRISESVDSLARAEGLLDGLTSIPLERAAVAMSSGNALASSGDEDHAAEHYHRAIQEFQGFSGAIGDLAGCWLNLGVVLAAGRNHRAALRSLGQALELFASLTNTLRQQASCWLGLGVVRHRNGEPEKAMSALVRAENLYERLGFAHRLPAAWFNQSLVALERANRSPTGAEQEAYRKTAATLALRAAENANQGRYQFPAEAERVVWAHNVAGEYIGHALRLANARGEETAVGLIVAKVRSAGIVTAVPRAHGASLGTAGRGIDADAVSAPHPPHAPLTAGSGQFAMANTTSIAAFGAAQPGLAHGTLLWRVPPPGVLFADGEAPGNEESVLAVYI